MSIPSEPGRFIGVFQKDRCPLCFLVHQYGFDHLKSLLEESVTDPHTRDRIFASRGFCPRHAWQAVRQRQALGIGLIFSGLLEREMKEVDAQPRFWNGSRVKPCPICQSEASCERVYARQFILEWSRSNELRQAFKEKGILCLPHLKILLAQKAPKETREDIKRRCLTALEGLEKDLNEFLAKQDYHRIQEKTGVEGDAWVRAVRIINGERE
jgi:hypothetical protein